MAYLGQAIQLLKLLSKAAWAFALYKMGFDAATGKQNEKAANNANKVNRARNRYASDSGFRNRVQRFFNKDK